jgi:arylsulfatase A-like enzyme
MPTCWRKLVRPRTARCSGITRTTATSWPGSAIRLGDDKLIRFHEDNRLELYDLKKDISESTDLAAKLPEKTRDLASRLDAWLKSVDARFPTPNSNYDPAREGEGYWWKQPGAFERWGKQRF